MSAFLSAEELRDLTGRTRRTLQQQALSAMGIPFVRRPDGTLAVAWDAVNQVMGVKTAKRKQIEPDWAALDAATT